MKPPVLLFAYANDRAAEDRYLRNLPEEWRRTKEAFRESRRTNSCELVECTNATIQQVVSECQAYNDRLVLFHFAGHADGKSLLFERPDGEKLEADAASFAEFLGSLSSVKLVMLNGCCTADQVRLLFQHGVPAIIATLHTVRDDVATHFADCFYRAIAKSATIESAYRQATAAVKATFCRPVMEVDSTSTARTLYRDVAVEGTHTLDWPWQIYGSRPARQQRIVAVRSHLSVLRAAVVVVATACGGALAIEQLQSNGPQAKPESDAEVTAPDASDDTELMGSPACRTLQLRWSGPAEHWRQAPLQQLQRELRASVSDLGLQLDDHDPGADLVVEVSIAYKELNWERACFRVSVKMWSQHVSDKPVSPDDYTSCPPGDRAPGYRLEGALDRWDGRARRQMSDMVSAKLSTLRDELANGVRFAKTPPGTTVHVHARLDGNEVVEGHDAGLVQSGATFGCLFNAPLQGVLSAPGYLPVPFNVIPSRGVTTIRSPWHEAR